MQNTSSQPLVRLMVGHNLRIKPTLRLEVMKCPATGSGPHLRLSEWSHNYKS